MARVNRAKLKPLVFPTILGLARSIVALEVGADRIDGTPFLAETAEGLFRKMVLMPPHLGAGMIGLTLGFAGHAVGACGKPFSQLPLERQREILDGWKYSPVSLTRDFVQFYEKMGVFIWYSLVEEAELAAEHA